MREKVWKGRDRIWEISMRNEICHPAPGGGRVEEGRGGFLKGILFTERTWRTTPTQPLFNLSFVTENYLQLDASAHNIKYWKSNRKQLP